MQEAENQTRALFCWWKRTGKAAPLERAGQVEIRDLHGCKERNREVQELAAVTGAVSGKGITVRFKYKGQTGEIQGVSFSKGEYTFKGSEIDRNFSFSKLDKCFGDAGLNTVGNQRQTAFTPVREPLPTQGKTDSPLITGSLGLFTASSPPADEEPNLNLRKKKKKKKQLNL